MSAPRRTGVAGRQLRGGALLSRLSRVAGRRCGRLRVLDRRRASRGRDAGFCRTGSAGHAWSGRVIWRDRAAQSWAAHSWRDVPDHGHGAYSAVLLAFVGGCISASHRSKPARRSGVPGSLGKIVPVPISKERDALHASRHRGARAAVGAPRNTQRWSWGNHHPPRRAWGCLLPAALRADGGGGRARRHAAGNPTPWRAVRRSRPIDRRSTQCHGARP